MSWASMHKWTPAYLMYLQYFIVSVSVWTSIASHDNSWGYHTLLSKLPLFIMNRGAYPMLRYSYCDAGGIRISQVIVLTCLRLLFVCSPSLSLLLCCCRTTPITHIIKNSMRKMIMISPPTTPTNTAAGTDDPATLSAENRTIHKSINPSINQSCTWLANLFIIQQSNQSSCSARKGS